MPEETELQDSRYLFVEVAAKRCAQLMRGAKPKVDMRAHKFTTLAKEEVAQGLVPWEFRDEEAEAEEAEAAAVEEEAEEGGDASEEE